jgi:glyoxylase-like metal-dependent hydrolase (beta-lactamase superfamily II)
MGREGTERFLRRRRGFRWPLVRACRNDGVAGPIPYVRDLDVSYGAVDQVSPLIRRVVAENPSRFTYLGTGTYIVGRGEVAVIDAGPAMDVHVDAILAALDADERVTHLVVTHTHTDHSPAAALVRERTDAPTYGFGPHGQVPADDPTDRVVFGDPDADGESDKNGGGAASSHTLREGADTAFVPDVVVSAGDVISGPGWTLEAVHTPGHTSNHLCYALAEERALFTGDHVMGWSTSVIGPPDGSLAQYLASLRLLLGRSDDVYWPTHGPPITDPPALVHAYLAHREERTEQILAALAAGASMLSEIVPIIYTDVPKQLWRAAAASSYAHLLQLVEEGKVVSDGPARRTASYSLA